METEVGERPAGLCESCEHRRRVETHGTVVYWRCVSDRAGLGKYPRLPVFTCTGYEETNSRQGE